MSETQYRKVRIYFRKEGDVRFLSHLDVMRTMDRALRRSALPIRFTEGMNPKVKMNFPTALPLGMESRLEVMEVQVERNVPLREVCERLAAELPPGFAPFDVDGLFTGEKWRVDEIHYEVTTDGDLPSAEEIGELLGRDRIPVARRKKEVDLRPLLRELRVESGRLVVSIAWTDSGTARPQDVLKTLGREAEEFRVVKTGVTFESSFGERIRKWNGS